MALTVPPPQIAYIKRLLEVPDETIKGFLGALVRAGPKFNVYDLADDVSTSVKLPAGLTLGLIRVLASLYLTKERDYGPVSTEEFVDGEVFPALKSAQTFSAEKVDLQWKKLRNFLVDGLSLERTVGTTAKAGPVLTQHERIFSGARIMTDLRPIFHLDVAQKPDAAVIIHMLRVTARDNFGRQEDRYFALDSNDLVLLKQIIERAMAKEKTLRGIIKDSGVTVLDPKLVF